MLLYKSLEKNYGSYPLTHTHGPQLVIASGAFNVREISPQHVAGVYRYGLEMVVRL